VDGIDEFVREVEEDGGVDKGCGCSCVEDNEEEECEEEGEEEDEVVVEECDDNAE
jgi:hypothetical protein